MSGLNQSVVWITGASSGLGRALALRMARAGHVVAASARQADALKELADEARPFCGSIRPYPVDTTDLNAVRATVAEITRALGPIEIAVLNAGTHDPMLAEEIGAERARRLIDVNLVGTINCLDPVLPSMIERGRGHIAIVASLAGYFGLPTSAVYGATKAGLINMAEALQPDLARHGIKTQIVNPGFVKTPLTAGNAFPMPFLMEVEDAADAFYRGLALNRFEITFPRRFSLILRLLQYLPYRLALAATARSLPKPAKSQVTEPARQALPGPGE